MWQTVVYTLGILFAFLLGVAVTLAVQEHKAEPLPSENERLTEQARADLFRPEPYRPRWPARLGVERSSLEKWEPSLADEMRTSREQAMRLSGQWERDEEDV